MRERRRDTPHTNFQQKHVLHFKPLHLPVSITKQQPQFASSVFPPTYICGFSTKSVFPYVYSWNKMHRQRTTNNSQRNEILKNECFAINFILSHHNKNARVNPSPQTNNKQTRIRHSKTWWIIFSLIIKRCSVSFFLLLCFVMRWLKSWLHWIALTMLFFLSFDGNTFIIFKVKLSLHFFRFLPFSSILTLA